MNKIILITTEGCIACNIAEKILSKAIKQCDIRDIKVEVVGFLYNKYKELVKRESISDFPATIFLKDDNVVDKFVGTTSVPQLISRIEHCFSSCCDNSE